MSNTSAPDLSNQIIWLTGASSGIGEAIVGELAPLCQRLYISARSENKLLPMTDEFSNVTALPCDITDEQSMKEAAAIIEANNGRLDTLIANAGTCEYVT